MGANVAEVGLLGTSEDFFDAISHLHRWGPAGDWLAVPKGHDCGLRRTAVPGADRGAVLRGAELIDYSGIGDWRPALESASRNSVCDRGAHWNCRDAAICGVRRGTARRLEAARCTFREQQDFDSPTRDF